MTIVLGAALAVLLFSFKVQVVSIPVLVLHNIEKKSTLISRGRRAHLDHHMDTSKLCTDFGSRVLFFANRDPKSVATFQLLVFHETMRANAFQRPTQLLKGLYK